MLQYVLKLFVNIYCKKPRKHGADPISSIMLWDQGDCRYLGCSTIRIIVFSLDHGPGVNNLMENTDHNLLSCTKVLSRNAHTAALQKYSQNLELKTEAKVHLYLAKVIMGRRNVAAFRLPWLDIGYPSGGMRTNLSWIR